MAQERTQLNWRWAWLGAAIILVLVFLSVQKLTRERLQVRVSQVARRSLASTISTNGQVEPENNFEVHSPLSTTVKAVYVRTGDEVKAGKVLVVLDDVQARARVATAESGVKAAQVAVEAATHNGTREQQQATAADLHRARLDRDQAQHDLDALVKLAATGAASPSEVAAARQRLASADAGYQASEASSKGRYSPAEVDRAQAALADAEANLAAARQTLSETVVHAPIDGTVYSLEVKPTQFIEEGKLMLQLADVHQERVIGYFDEPEIGNLSVGQPVQIKWDARPGKVWHGHIERVPVTVVRYTTRNVGEAPIKVEDADGELLPDTNVTVTVTTSNQANALSIPREALHVENGRHFVYRVMNDELKRTPVVIGTFNLTQVAIISGLSDGDWVATGTSNGQPLQEGVPVKVLK